MTKPGIELDLSVISTSYGYLLRRTMGKFKSATLPILKINGLSSLELTTLVLIKTNDHCILRTLAEAVGIDTPAMNRIINSLEDKGFVNRLKSEDDARYTFFQITKSGQKCMKSVKEQVIEVENKLLSRLTNHERKALSKILRKYL